MRSYDLKGQLKHPGSVYRKVPPSFLFSEHLWVTKSLHVWQFAIIIEKRNGERWFAAMSKGFIAKASIIIESAVVQVWDALTNPAVIRQYMFGTNVVSDWEEGSPIVWKGEWRKERCMRIRG